MDCTVIILAGGQGIRMGRLGRLLAKAALVVYDRPILVRLLDQIHQAGLQKVVVSTSPSHHLQLHALISNYRGEVKDYARQTLEIEVFKNCAHDRGPLEALNEVLKYIETPRCLMCLGDIFFRDNPFIPFLAEMPGLADCLGVTDAVDPRELSQGGLVYCQGRDINAVVERTQSAPTGALRWSGIALFSRELVEDLELFLSQAPVGSPEGDLFEFRRKRGRPLRAIPGPDFVNINSPAHLLLATIYAAMEAHHGQTNLYNSLAEAAIQLRSTLLTPRPE